MLMAMRGIKECMRVRLSRRLHSFSSYRLLLVLFKYPAAVQVQDFFLLFFVVLVRRCVSAEKCWNLSALHCLWWSMSFPLRSLHPLPSQHWLLCAADGILCSSNVRRSIIFYWNSFFLFVFTFFLFAQLSFIGHLFIICFTLFSLLWRRVRWFLSLFFKREKSTSATPPIQSRELDDQIIKSSPERRCWNSCMIHTQKRVATLSKSEPANATIKKKTQLQRRRRWPTRRNGGMRKKELKEEHRMKIDFMLHLCSPVN